MKTSIGARLVELDASELGPKLADARQAESWDGFVNSHPEASLYHSFAWKEIMERAYGKSCYYLYLEGPESWIGILPLVHMRGPFTANRLVSLPFLDGGGILAESVTGASALRAASLELARSLGATGLDLRGGYDSSSSLKQETERFGFQMELAGSEEGLWRSLSSKVRNQIRKAEGQGLVTCRGHRPDLPTFYSIFAQNMRDLGSPTHSLTFFKEILRALPSSAVYLTFTKSGDAVAGGIALRFATSVIVPWASSLRSARPACPNHSLYWKILCDCIRDGAGTFDFGRSWLGSGTFHFKKQWGATPRPLVWRSLDADGRVQSERSLDPRRHKLLSAMWRRLPPRLAILCGPAIRRQLAN